MDDIQLAHFFELIRTMPLSAQHFVLVPDENRDATTISKILYEEAFFNVFNRLEIGGKKMRMIPSFGMVKALCDATGNDGFTFKLVVGESTPESLRRSIIEQNVREVCIHCPEIAPAPPTADGFSAKPIDFMYHDIYHVYVCRFVPEKVRKFFCELADTVNPDKLNNTDEMAKFAAMSLY